MDGDIINPRDLHCRVLAADEVALSLDGNQVCALVGPDLVRGVSGFGAAVHDALRELADHLVGEAVWIDVPADDQIDLAQVVQCQGGVLQTNVVELYHVGEAWICALASSNNSSTGIFGLGESVHDVLRSLANKLVETGVWVEVTARTEWHFAEDPDELFGEDDQD
jgi:hypothetical protein